MSLAVIFGLLCIIEVYGQGDLKIKNTAKQIKPGVYECVIYLDITYDVSKTIDDVTYTMPPGYSNRKQRGQKTRPGIRGYFSSDPFITTEEAVIDILIDFKGPHDQYITYKLILFSRRQSTINRAGGDHFLIIAAVQSR